MPAPVQISYRNVEANPEIEERIREEAHKLTRHYRRITICRVLIETSAAHRRWGRPYHVRIEVSVPGKDIVARQAPRIRRPIATSLPRSKSRREQKEDAYKDLHFTIGEAFKTAQRRLQEYARRQRGETKARKPRQRPSVREGFPVRTIARKESRGIESPGMRKRRAS